MNHKCFIKPILLKRGGGGGGGGGGKLDGETAGNKMENGG